ncbi:HAD family hydrolase [Desertibaculum subflavum]|uniref:HAD family hydrolase n=1 Tax=Desertibaculum subflavum TaxID=2268458 RepID=UPI000E6682A2
MRARFPTALLFDLDGTLLDTDALHFDAWNCVLAGHSRAIPLEFYRRHIMGAANEAIMAALFPELGTDAAMREIEAKEAAFRVSLGQVAPMPGLARLLDWAEARDLPTAVVTNAPRANAELMLAALGLCDRFDTLVIGDELAHGKPHPLPYLTGLEKLGAAPDTALAFEDSVNGIRAAAGAEIVTFGMLGAFDEATLREHGAAHVIHDFEDARLWAVLQEPPAGRSR